MASSKKRLMGRPSHREDLRAELLAAGRSYVAEHGHDGLSMRTLAEAVGVSSGAPYHHFADRRSLLLAVATEGYNQLMDDAVALQKADLPSREKLKKMGLRFLRFSDENPRLFQLMYESELTRPTDASLLLLQRKGFRALRSAIVDALPNINTVELDVRVAAFWAAVYGFTTLQLKENIQDYEAVPIGADEFAEQVIERAADSALSQ